MGLLTKVSPSKLAKSTKKTTTTIKKDNTATTKTTRTTSGGSSISKSTKLPASSKVGTTQKAAKKAEAQKKATKQNQLASTLGFDSSSLNPLHQLQRDAATGTTVRDKITYAKTTGAASSAKNNAKTKEENEAIKTRQTERKKKNAAQTLSKEDRKLTKRDRTLIRDAKTAYDQAKEQGDTEAMARAHQRAENVRNRHGYSGGVSGNEKPTTELTNEEKAKLNDAGEKLLRVQKFNLKKAQDEGNKEKISAVETLINSIMENNAYRDRAYKATEKTTGNNTTVDAGATETVKEFIENADAGLTAAAKGVVGSIPSLVETSAKATDNLVRENNKEDLQKWANNLGHYKFLLEWLQSGHDVNGETESSLQQKIRIAQNAKDLLESSVTVDSSLPGQTLMRESSEAAEKFLEGKTGASRLLGQAALSTAQMVPALAAGALVPGAGAAVATGIMSAQAAGQKAFELNDRNVDPAEAQARGILSGGIEALTEKIPVESLLKVVKAGGGTSMLRNVAKQAGLEATEESASYVLNYLADKAAKDPEAKFSLQELAESAAIGAISGGALAGGATAVNRLTGNSAQQVEPSRAEQAFSNAVGRINEQAKNTLVDVLNRRRNQAAQAESEAAQPSQTAQNPAGTDFAAEQAQTPGRSGMRVQSEEDGASVPIKTGTLAGNPSDTETPSYFSDIVAQDAPAVNVPESEEPPNNVIQFPGNLPEGMGAMSSGGAGEFANWQSRSESFHPINEAAYRQTKERYGRAPVEIPIRDLGGKLTSKTVSTLANAGITNNQLVESLEADAAAGGFSYDAYRDKDALSKAESKIKDNGFQRAKEEWIASVKAGKFTKDNVALGLTLINNAANSGTLEGHIDAHDLTALYVSYARTGAQALQATSILNKMTPAGQLYVLTRTIDNLNQEIIERHEKTGKLIKDPDTGLTKKQAEEIASSIEQERDDAIRVIQGMISAYAEEQGKESGDSSWVKQLGDDLARNAVRRISDKQSTRTIYRDILSDLNAFMSQYVDTGINARQSPRTATERLADYYHNRDEYIQAWKIAKERLNEKYPLRNNALEGFINADDPLNQWPGEDKVIIKAIAESIADQEISKRMLVVRGELDAVGLADDIVRDVSQVTGIPYEETSDLIESTLLENIWERLGADGRNAESIIKEDVRKAMRGIGVTFADVLKRGSTGREVLAKYLSEELVSQYGISRFSADSVGEEVSGIYYELIRERANSKLRSIFGEKKARERRTAADRLDEMIRLGAFTQAGFKETATEKLFGDPGVEIPSELLHDFMQANTDQERREIRKAIYKSVAEQVPATWRDKLDAWRYTSMLGTLRTQDRNILGNLGFAPVRVTKNVVGTGLEKAFSRNDRTKSILNPVSKEDRARYLAAMADFKEVKDEVMAGGKYDELKSEIRDNQRVFKFAPLEIYRKATSWGLESGDQVFTSTAYADSLAGWLKANKVTAEDFLASSFDPAKKQAAREYAAKEAQKATYRDLNAASELVTRLSGLQRSDNKVTRGVGLLVEGALPFKKTPVNILVRGLEYSPFGLAKGVGDAYVTARSNSWRNAKDGNFALAQKLAEGKRALASGAKTSSEVIDEIASGLTGTALLALGAGMAAAGVITGGGSGDDKQDDFDSLQGHQNYALEINGQSFTLDWLAPEALPFFVGVEMYNYIRGLQTGESNKADWAKSVTRIAEPMLEMSMLQSLNDILTSYNTEDPLISVVASAAVSYLSQFVPTLGGQIERTMEDTRQTTFIDKDSAVPSSVQRMLGNIGNKIPGWEYNQTDYLDEWGRTQSTGTVLNRVLNNFLNPSYTSTINTTDVETELQRLYDAGYDGMFPTAVQRSSEIDGKRVTADQWSAWQTEKGQSAYNALKNFIGTDEYKNLSDDQKAKFVEKVYDYASASGKVAAGGDAEDASKWIQAAEDAGSVGLSKEKFISMYAYKSSLENELEDDEYKASVKQGIWEQYINGRSDLSDEQKNYVKENVRFWQMTPADAGSYNKAVAAGYNDPEEITQLIDGWKAYDFDNNGSRSNVELYGYITAAGDAAEQQKMWDALKPTGTEDSLATFKKKYAAKYTAVTSAKKALDSAVSSEKQEAFTAATSGIGTVSQKKIKKALLSVDATDAERIAYYNFVKAKQGWKKSWYQVKM